MPRNRQAGAQPEGSFDQCLRDLPPRIYAADRRELNGFIARLTPSTGIDAPLAARALWLEDQQTRCLIVSLDVLGLSTPFVNRVVQGLATRLNVSEQQVVLASTHTHSGPMTCRLRGIGPADEDCLGVLESRIYEAASAAAEGKRRVQVASGAAPVEIGVNRRQIDPSDGSVSLGCNPEGPTDRVVRVLHLRGETSSIVLFNHACHPYCLGPQHSLISPDFPGHAAALLEEQGHQAIYLNGCSGDLAPYQACQGPQAARSEGQRLAEAALHACRHARLEEAPRLRVESVRFQLPYDDLPPLATLEADLEKADRTVRPQERENQVIHGRVRAAWDQWLSELEQVRHGRRRLLPLEVRVSLIQIGRGAIVALPGEVFFQIGQRIAAQLDADPVCVAAYCHGYIGYVPTRAAFAQGGYEVEESHRYVGLWRVSPAAENLLQEQVDLLEERLYAC